MKKIIIALLVLTLLPFVGFADGISVTINGNPLSFDASPIMLNDRVLVPMRAIFEALGAKVLWDGGTNTISATDEEKQISMQIENPIMTVNNRQITLDVPPSLSNDRTMVPVRAVSEALDAFVSWDNETQTVAIISSKAAFEMSAVTEYSYKNDAFSGSATAYYPKLSGTGSAIEAINADLEKTAHDYVAACKNSPGFSLPSFVFEQSCAYNIKGNVLSVLYTDYFDNAGQVTLQHTSANYSLETGEKLRFDDIINMEYGEIMTMLIESYMTMLFSSDAGISDASIDLLQINIEKTCLYLDRDEARFILDSLWVSPSTVSSLTYPISYKDASKFKIDVQ